MNANVVPPLFAADNCSFAVASDEQLVRTHPLYPTIEHLLRNIVLFDGAGVQEFIDKTLATINPEFVFVDSKGFTRLHPDPEIDAFVIAVLATIKLYAEQSHIKAKWEASEAKMWAEYEVVWDHIQGQLRSEYEEGARQRTKSGKRLPKPAKELLTAWFEANLSDPYPDNDEKDVLMLKTGLDIGTIEVFFTNLRRRNAKYLGQKEAAALAAGGGGEN